VKVPDSVRRAAHRIDCGDPNAASPKTDLQCPVNRATNGAAAPISPLPSDETGLAALADPKTFQDTKRKMPAFRDLIRGKPRPSLFNAVAAINALSIEARQDLFHHRIIVKHKGDAPTIPEGVFTDDTIGAIRSLINNKYRIDCGDANTLAAIKEIARNHSVDPVRDYLDECQSKWDGKKRIDTWVIDYMGVEDTPLHRAIGRIMLIASVRRARVPGCKFDQICVLEGEEGLNKSSAIKVLAGEENFSDQSVLNVSDREAQEQLEGVWLHESADLTGLKKAQVDNSIEADPLMRGCGKIARAAALNGLQQMRMRISPAKQATGGFGRYPLVASISTRCSEIAISYGAKLQRLKRPARQSCLIPSYGLRNMKSKRSGAASILGRT
jgi:hypothetical protein